jgi:DNA mismatch repair protein MutL
MKKINQLSKKIIEQIAAGEVIHNPASVIKELVENAIDAQAENIRINLENSGFNNITVIDDGTGISKEDLPLAIAAHCTSKLESLEDLNQIKNLGFRGEALSSIDQVSKILIKSRPKEIAEDLGWQIKNKNLEKIGMSFGTVIEVSELFYNTPARKKFLKSKNIELRRIVELLEAFALAHPQVSFSLKNNQREILKFKKEKIEKRIENVLGEDFSRKLIPLKIEKEHFKISGFIFHPQLAREQQKKQFIFVNKRNIKNKKIRATVKKSFSTLITKSAQPAFILFIEVPENNIDVNIHPQKTEIKFLESQKIYDAIFEASQIALSKNKLIYKSEDNKYLYPQELPSVSKKLHLADHLNMEATSQFLKENSQAWLPKKDLNDLEILQLKELYLLYETNEGLMIVDQHAAHERILYEQYLTEFKAKKNFQKIKLDKKLKINLSSTSKVMISNYKKELAELSFEFLEEKNQIYLKTIPKILSGRTDLREIVEETILELENDDSPNLLDELTLRVIFYLACRSAIKANEYLTPKERKNLIEKLAKCQNPYTCPHGRPTQILIHPKNLEKMFHRI